MDSEESDVESDASLPKPPVKKQKLPKQEALVQKKKTKDMIHEALTELKSRKGVSLYAIKKYITEKYKVDADKNNYLIKKQIKNGVIDGTIVQMKGVGASGSFKLAPSKPKKKETTEADSEQTKTEKPKIKKTKSEKPKNKPTTEKGKKKPEDTKEKTTEMKIKKTDEKQLKTTKENIKKTKGKMAVDSDQPKKMQSKMAKSAATTSKKKSLMMKRKSIGTIIKPPKMKPKNYE